MKKILYISLFTFLGLLLQFLIHGGIEIGYIALLNSDFKKFSLGLNWHQWFAVHNVLTVVLLLAGLTFGFWQGRYWWQKIYAEKSRKSQKTKQNIKNLPRFKNLLI